MLHRLILLLCLGLFLTPPLRAEPNNPLAGTWLFRNGDKWTVPNSVSDPFKIVKEKADGHKLNFDAHWVKLGKSFKFFWGGSTPHVTTCTLNAKDRNRLEVSRDGKAKGYWTRLPPPAPESSPSPK